MATHSSVLVWRIPGTGEPGGLPSLGSHRVGHDWSDLAAAATVEVSIFQWVQKVHPSIPLLHLLVSFYQPVLFFFFFLAATWSIACGILVHPPGIEPTSLNWKGRVITTGLPGKSLVFFILKIRSVTSSLCTRDLASSEMVERNNQSGKHSYSTDIYWGSALSLTLEGTWQTQ